MSTETTEGGAKEGASPHEPVNVEDEKIPEENELGARSRFRRRNVNSWRTLRESYRTSQREAGVFASVVRPHSHKAFVIAR